MGLELMAEPTAGTGVDEEGLTPVKPVEAELLVVTGMSGAGRSTASDALEDHGWYVVENLPPQMLVRRFEQGRRPHPLQGGGRILDGIAAERELLKELRDSSDLVLDTSAFNVHGLATAITELFSETGPVALRLNIMSFGFKYGLPVDANYVADVRFIPNPHWVPKLRPHTGLDQDVSDYVLEAEGVPTFVERYVMALEPVLDGYRRENKHYATIAVGCTGGKHRSVAVAVELSKKLAQYPRVTVTTTHRDLGRE